MLKIINFTRNVSFFEKPAKPNATVTVEVNFRKVDNSAVFGDVSTGDRFYEAVKWACDSGIMNGVGSGRFAPDDVVSRVMVWTVLARMNGKDISGENWAKQAQVWAVEAGVSDGTTVSENISREQLVTMLHRFLGKPAVSGNLSGYPDTAKVADWAED